MPIRPFLAGQDFEPELIQQMSSAFVGACQALGLELVDYPATRLVARKIVELAGRGLKDAKDLLGATLKAFQAGKQ